MRLFSAMNEPSAAYGASSRVQLGAIGAAATTGVAGAGAGSTGLGEERKCQTSKPAFTPSESSATTSHGEPGERGGAALFFFLARGASSIFGLACGWGLLE